MSSKAEATAQAPLSARKIITVELRIIAHNTFTIWLDDKPRYVGLSFSKAEAHERIDWLARACDIDWKTQGATMTFNLKAAEIEKRKTWIATADPGKTVMHIKTGQVGKVLDHDLTTTRLTCFSQRITKQAEVVVLSDAEVKTITPNTVAKTKGNEIMSSKSTTLKATTEKTARVTVDNDPFAVSNQDRFLAQVGAANAKGCANWKGERAPKDPNAGRFVIKGQIFRCYRYAKLLSLTSAQRAKALDAGTKYMPTVCSNLICCTAAHATESDTEVAQSATKKGGAKKAGAAKGDSTKSPAAPPADSVATKGKKSAGAKKVADSAKKPAVAPVPKYTKQMSKKAARVTTGAATAQLKAKRATKKVAKKVKR